MTKQQIDKKIKDEEGKVSTQKKRKSRVEQEITFEELNVQDSPASSKCKEEVKKVKEEVKAEMSMKKESLI